MASLIPGLETEMRLAVLVLGTVLLVTLAAPLIAPYDPMQTNPPEAMQAPDYRHPLGTDHLGRDVLSRVLHGGRRTLLVASLATVFAVVPGLLLGISAGALGEAVDRGITIWINSLLAFPSLMLALVALTLLGQGTWQLAVATGGAQIALFAQVSRSAVLAVRSAAYVESAYAIGATWQHVVVRHILSNARPTLFGYAGVTFSYCIINSAALTFLGLGGEPGVPDWGVILAEGRDAFRTAPWVAIVPGLVIVITVLSVNTIADHLAEAR